MNSSAFTTDSSSLNSEAVFVLPLIPLVEVAASNDEDGSPSDSASRQFESDFSDSSVEAMD